MGSYDFQNDFQNDAAKKNYDAAMEGKTRKGLDIFEKPHTWDEENPVNPIRDTPTMNFVPIPTLSTEGFSSYSLPKKILVISAIVLGAAALAYSAISFFRDGGFKTFGIQGKYFW